MEKDNYKTKGKLIFEKIEIKQTRDIAIYLDIYFKDEDGNLYKMHTSSFLHDLKIENKGE